VRRVATKKSSIPRTNVAITQLTEEPKQVLLTSAFVSEERGHGVLGREEVELVAIAFHRDA
jgi:hypothetical protein